jgi:hypothetical protein
MPWTSSWSTERKKERKRIIIIIIRNGAKTISLQTLFGRLNNKILITVVVYRVSKMSSIKNILRGSDLLLKCSFDKCLQKNPSSDKK